MLILNVNKLSALLSERGMTQTELSRALGLCDNAISALIVNSRRGGKMLLKTAQAIARVLKVDVRSFAEPSRANGR